MRQRGGLRNAAAGNGAPPHGLRGGVPGPDRRAPARGGAGLPLELQRRLPVRALNPEAVPINSTF